MRPTVVRYWFLSAITLGLWSSSLPTIADALAEASPEVQSQSIPQEAKAEPSRAATPAAATKEDDSLDEGPNDPLEPLNRFIFGINDLLDFVILRPVAEIYRAIVPDPVRTGVTNLLDNLFAPVVFLNHVLQGNPEEATATLFRFTVNSTLGLLGLVDVTSNLGYPRYDTDFNQTLTAWGVETGPYLVLPLVGPSSFRGGIGLAGDYFADPLNLYLRNRHHHKHHSWLYVRYGVDLINHREKVIETLDNLREGSLDMYVTLRSIYFQRQAYMAKKLKPANNAEADKKKG